MFGVRFSALCLLLRLSTSFSSDQCTLQMGELHGMLTNLAYSMLSPARAASYSPRILIEQLQYSPVMITFILQQKKHN